METDHSTLRIIATRVQPEYEERFYKWLTEAWWPLFITIPGYEEVNYYRIVKENPQYNKHLQTARYTNRIAQIKSRSDPKTKALQKEQEF